MTRSNNYQDQEYAKYTQPIFFPSTESLIITDHSNSLILNNEIRRLVAYCVSGQFIHQECSKEWKQFSSIWISLYPESKAHRWDDTVVYLSLDSINGHVFIFTYGVVVCWGLLPRQENAILSLCKLLEEQNIYEPEQAIHSEEFKYQILSVDNDSRLSFSSYILNDFLVLDSDLLIYKLLLSHAFAQAAKLTVFESWLEQSVALIHSLQLFQHGKHVSRFQITRSIGQFFDFLIKVNWRIHVFGECPEFLWHMPAILLSFYQCFYRYLDVKHRTDILKKKSKVLADTLTMLRGHINSRLQITLLKIVILVIFLSVVITILRLIVEQSLEK